MGKKDQRGFVFACIICSQMRSLPPRCDYVFAHLSLCRTCHSHPAQSMQGMRGVHLAFTYECVNSRWGMSELMTW